MDATATQQLVQIVAEDQRRAVEPVLRFASRERLNIADQGIGPIATWAVVLRNIGNGPALDIHGYTYDLDADGAVENKTWAFQLEAIPAGEDFRVVFPTTSLADFVNVGGTFADITERDDRRLTFGYPGVTRRGEPRPSFDPLSE